MLFDSQNPIIKLCAEGIEKEGLNQHQDARELYQQAWEKASNNFEKYISAHYLARQQKTIKEKLDWDIMALNFALLISSEEINGSLPSLYLNIAKGYEDLGDFQMAITHYNKGLSFEQFLLNDGYGQLILSGLKAGLKRLGQIKSQI